MKFTMNLLLLAALNGHVENKLLNSNEPMYVPQHEQHEIMLDDTLNLKRKERNKHEIISFLQTIRLQHE